MKTIHRKKALNQTTWPCSDRIPGEPGLAATTAAAAAVFAPRLSCAEMPLALRTSSRCLFRRVLQAYRKILVQVSGELSSEMEAVSCCAGLGVGFVGKGSCAYCRRWNFGCASPPQDFEEGCFLLSKCDAVQTSQQEIYPTDKGSSVVSFLSAMFRPFVEGYQVCCSSENYLFSPVL